MSYTLNTEHRAKSKNARIRYLVIHYTAVPFDTALHILTEGTVSAHYLIPEHSTTPHLIYQLVPEHERAWHAGGSGWQGFSALNDTSIGIELVNLGCDESEGKRIHPPYHANQISALIHLAKEVTARYAIDPTCVVGHSDIAPERKIDPGPHFPWKTLYEHGIGAWPDESVVAELTQRFHTELPNVTWLQQQLQHYGYTLQITHQWDTPTHAALRAFQMHFRPSDHTGVLDAESCARLASLNLRYRPPLTA